MRASNGTHNLYSYGRLPVSAILKRGEVFILSPHVASTLDRSQMLGALTRLSSIYRQLFETLKGSPLLLNTLEMST